MEKPPDPHNQKELCEEVEVDLEVLHGPVVDEFLGHEPLWRPVKEQADQNKGQDGSVEGQQTSPINVFHNTSAKKQGKKVCQLALSRYPV